MSTGSATGRITRLPTASHRLLLAAAITPGDDARSAWTRWRRAGGDVDAVGSAAFHVLPLVYRNLDTLGIDDPDLPRLKGVYRYTWVINQRLLHGLAPAIAALRRGDIATLMLGGPAVSLTHYPDAGARRIDDAGVLVAPGDLERAAGILATAGFTSPAGVDPDRMRVAGHATTLAGPGDVHFRLHWRALSESVADEDYWAAAVPIEVGAAATLAPGPTQQLLYVCTDGARSGPQALTWIADAALILRTAEREIDWPGLVEGAARRGAAFTAGVALTILQELAVGPVPDAVLAELARRPRDARERLLMALARRSGPGAVPARLWDAHRRRSRT